MGQNQVGFCCSDGGCGMPTNADMAMIMSASPHRKTGSEEDNDTASLPGIGSALDIGIVDVDRDRIADQEMTLMEISKIGDDSSLTLRALLLRCTRQDDAPGVLQIVADGAEVSDMGEALRLASQRGAATVVRELVAVGISVNECCPHSEFSPLQLAASSGHLSVCELLLDALADVHKSVRGTTALNLARKMGNNEVEEIMERHMASLVMEAEGDGDEASQWSRRAHVLPRVSPILSEAVLQALPSSTVSLDQSPRSGTQQGYI